MKTITLKKRKKKNRILLCLIREAKVTPKESPLKQLQKTS